MTESEIVKLCVVLIPMATMAVTVLIAGVAEWFAETDEGKKLLAYMTEED